MSPTSLNIGIKKLFSYLVNLFIFGFLYKISDQKHFSPQSWYSLNQKGDLRKEIKNNNQWEIVSCNSKFLELTFLEMFGRSYRELVFRSWGQKA